MKRILLFILLFSIFLISCNISDRRITDLEKERAIITKIISDCTGWAETKDFDRIEEIVAHDSDFFIYHQRSTGDIHGYEEFTGLFKIWADDRFVATDFDLKDLRIVFSRSGDVAWYSAMLDDCYEWDGVYNCLQDTRWTGVLEKRDRKWVIVQMHFSFASDKVIENHISE
jgi:hypothetical protein